jgi:hypothetical protein
MNRWRISLLKCSAIVVAGTLLSFGRGWTQDSEVVPTRDRPALELDLMKFGYERYRSAHDRWPTFVDFTDANRLALAWLTPDDRVGVAAEKAYWASPVPAHLHVLILDAATGEKQGLREWPTLSTPVRFMGIRDGKFLTCAGGVLRMLSSKFEVIREEQLPSERGCLDPGRKGVSPSRRSLLLSFPDTQTDGRTLFSDTLLDIESFRPIAKWTENSRC